MYVIGVCASALLAGCTTDDSDPNKRERIAPVAGKGSEALMARETTPTETPSTNAPPPIVLPASGRVHSVNIGERFVVIDYTLGGMPPLQSVLNVYRSNQKVGEIRLSGPERNGFVAGDIIDGFLQVDDEVRIY